MIIMMIMIITILTIIIRILILTLTLILIIIVRTRSALRLDPRSPDSVPGRLSRRRSSRPGGSGARAGGGRRGRGERRRRGERRGRGARAGRATDRSPGEPGIKQATIVRHSSSTQTPIVVLIHTRILHFFC